MKTDSEIKRGEIIRRTTAGFTFKGYSDRFACTPHNGETKWFDTAAEASAWLDKLPKPIVSAKDKRVNRLIEQS